VDIESPPARLTLCSPVERPGVQDGCVLRRSPSPPARRTKPNPAASHVLKPVKGRVFFDLPFGSAELVLVVSAVVAVGVGVGVVVAGVVSCGVLVDPDEPEPDPEPEEPELLWW
jgi:hypothetical protein